MSRIAKRTLAVADSYFPRPPHKVIQLMMSLTACHANGCPLDLDALEKATDGDLLHDVFGIHRHVCTDTGRLLNGFHPRHAKRETTAA